MKKKKIVRVSPEMAKRIQTMARQTWDAIGGDCLRNLEFNGDKPEMPRSHVVEVVCDAGYMDMHGGDKEAYKFWETLSYAQQAKYVAKAFPTKSYGW
jgi:hypothetical protein